MKKRILVLGASGLLGRPVARQLQEDGFEVRGLARNPEKAGDMFGESFEVVAGDARERARAAMRPEMPSVSVMPLWVARVMGVLTRNEMLKFAAELMGYFEKTPEGDDQSEANRLLGAPTTTLDAWLEARAKKGHGREEREEAQVAVAWTLSG